jgi:hypothetical protein
MNFMSQKDIELQPEIRKKITVKNTNWKIDWKGIEYFEYNE